MKRPLAWLICAALVVLGLVWRLRSQVRDVDDTTVNAVDARTEPATGATRLRSDAEAALEARRDAAATDLDATARETLATPGQLAQVASKTTLTVVCVARETGAPLSNITVWVRDADEKNPRASAVGTQRGSLREAPSTDERGRAEFDLPPARPLLLVTRSSDEAMGQPPVASTFEKKLDPLAPGEQRELRIELLTRDDLSFHGLVRARETQSPIAGARVTRLDAPDVVTNAEGRFVAPYASWNPPAWMIRAPHFSAQAVYPVDAATAEAPFTIELERAAELVVDLRGMSTEQRARARLTATTLSRELVHSAQRTSHWASPFEDPEWETLFDAAGRATLQELPAGARLTLAAKSGDEILHTDAEPTVLAPGEKRELQWTLQNGCRVLVRVRGEDAQPASSIHIWRLPAVDGPTQYVSIDEIHAVVQENKSDEHGIAEFERVPAGTWRIAPKPVADAPDVKALVGLPLRLTIGAHDAELTVDLQLARALYITGRVLDPSGAPAPHIGVYGARSDGGGVIANGDAAGRFTLGPLAAGLHRLSTVSVGEWADSEPVEVQAGAQDVELRLRTGASIRGRVVDAQTGAGARARLVWTVAAGPRGWVTTRVSQLDGTFEFTGLAPNVYALCAVTEDGRAGIVRGVDTAAGRSVDGILVSVSPAARLRVRYEAQRGTASAHVSCDGVEVPCDMLTAGATATWTVPPGALHVSVESPDLKESAQDVTLAAGEERELVFRAND